MVNNQAEFKPILDLSKFADERWEPIYGICFDGTLAILTKSSDRKTTFWRFDDDVIQKLELPLSFAYAPQALPDRSVLVTTAKRESLIFSEEGDLLHTLSLGDFSDVQVSFSGLIWTCYQDMVGGDVRCARTDDTTVWSLNGDEVCRRAGSSVDCYALNVCEDVVWANYAQSDGFAVIQIDRNGGVEISKNPFSGAFAIAADCDRVLLYGGYVGKKNRCVVQKLGADGRFRDPVFYSVKLPVAVLDSDTVRSRGQAVHLVAGSTWYQLSLDDLSR